MIKELEKYLNKVTDSIPDSEDAQRVRWELEDHIMTKVELKLLSGMSEESAVREVLSAMGNQEELREEFAEAHSVHKLRSKIIYEDNKGQCQYLAEQLGRKLGIPYERVRKNLDISDKELLIVIKKENDEKGRRSPLVKYLQDMEKGKLKIVVMIYTCFCTGTKAIHTTKQSMDYASGYNQNAKSSLKKMLLDKGIPAVDERYCFRSYKRLGLIAKQDILTEITYFARMLGVEV